VIPASLHAHADSLRAEGAQVVASPDEARAATHELLRTHHQAGLSRAEVEGRWTRITDRVWQHKGVSVVSTPDLCVADKDELRLALDPLIGVEVHLVLTLESFSQQLYGGWLSELRSGRTTGWEKYAARVLDADPEHRQAERFWAGHNLPALLGRWGWTYHADRLHVVAARDLRQHWFEVLDLVGLSSFSLPAVVPAYADPAGVAVLRRVNRQLEHPLGRGAMDLLTRSDTESRAMPLAPTTSLAPLVERWAEELARSGHDVRGDLAALVDTGEARALPGRGDQVAVAVDALAEALAENSRLASLVTSLEAERARLDRKRRRLKRRLRKAERN
jgi:hypothetical protein